MMQNKKSQVEMIVGFVIPMVLMMVILLVVKVALAVGFGPLERTPVSATLAGTGTTSACDYWLINFLRTKTSGGTYFSDMLAQAGNFQQEERFKSKAQDYFKNNYRRGIGVTNARWALKAETAAHTPIINIGEAETLLKRSCTQKIPSEKGPITVTLGVDY